MGKYVWNALSDSGIIRMNKPVSQGVSEFNLPDSWVVGHFEFGIFWFKVAFFWRGI